MSDLQIRAERIDRLRQTLRQYLGEEDATEVVQATTTGDGTVSVVEADETAVYHYRAAFVSPMDNQENSDD
jgi:hypothetical protein